MSGTITTTGYGLLPTLINNAGTVHAQLDKLTQQISTGLIANTYAGLGAGVHTSLALGSQIVSLQTYSRNIDQATGQMQVAQAALTQIQQIAQTFAAKMPDLNGLDPQGVDDVAASARDALEQVADLLDTTDGNVYVFAGQDSSNPPVPDPGDILNSNFYTQINDAVSTLSTHGAAATAATTLNVAAATDPTTSPFSAYLSGPTGSVHGPTVQTGANSFVTSGIVASANMAVVSSGTSTTGSYMRDLMRSLATLGSLSSTQVTDPNFMPLVADTTTSLNGAIATMAADVGVLGTRQSALANTQTQLTAVSDAMTSQVSTVQDVDMAAAISQLTSTQTQLQESYKLIVNTQALSLVNYLPT